MVRVKGGPTARARHKKVVKSAKGYRGKRNSTFRMAFQALMKAGLNAYKGRKQKKRDMRQLWISRISAALKLRGLNYSKAKNAWLHAQMDVDRKNLSEIAIQYPAIFDKIADIAKK